MELSNDAQINWEFLKYEIFLSKVFFQFFPIWYQGRNKQRQDLEKTLKLL